ncbi:hypothetical protein SAMN02910327_00421 [Peptostreptococcaceae bacterium pGA-8]|nr:hypothetical protein SAMN02910327_00421 [Peptostreptococcaceae bacterium pGA-8]
MIEKILLDYINQNSTVKACMEKPQNNDTYILLEKIGGGEKGHIGKATFAVQSIAPTLFKAAELNEKIKKIIKNAIELDSIVKVEINSDYNYTDPTTKTYRYQAVVNIVYY